MLPPFAPTCCAKRTVHTRTVCFFVSNRMYGIAPFLRRTTSPAVPFVSFLLRRKEAKENPLPERCFPMLPPVAPTCSAKRTVHTRTVRFFRSESCAEKRLFSVGSPLPPCLLSRFFLEEKKQKKIHCRSVVFLCSRRLRQRAAQNGRFIREPSVFSFLLSLSFKKGNCFPRSSIRSGSAP